MTRSSKSCFECGAFAVTTRQRVLTFLLAVGFASVSCGWALPQPPGSFQAVPSDARVTLSWAEAPGAIDYQVKRAATASGAFTLVVSNVVGGRYEDVSVRNGSIYFYSISARDAEGDGPDTPRLRAVPSAAVLDWLGPGAKVEKLAGNFQFIEGPVWLREGGLIFSDINANRLYRWTLGDGASVFRANSGAANGNTLDLQGRLLTCEHTARRVSRTEPDGSVTALVTEFNGKRFNAPNDIAVKSDGTIWFTDPNYGAGQLQPGRWVYRFHPDNPTATLVTVATNFDQPNGLAFSPDEKRLYIADSGAPHHVRVFDVQPDNSLANSRIFAIIAPGVPDGMRVDPAGRVFVTAGDGVQVFSPEGTLLDKLRTPETAANVGFGGPDGTMVFITANTSLYGITRTPDLVIAGLQRVPFAPKPGQSVRFVGIVKNQGTALSAGGLARFSISIDNQTNLLASVAIEALPPDASVVVRVESSPGEGWVVTPGVHRAYGFIDFENRLAESNEKNNVTNIVLSIAEPATDTDGDGASDLEEIAAQTDPAAATSVLRIEALERLGGDRIALRWLSRPSVQYRVSAKSGVTDLYWVDFPETIDSQGGSTEWNYSGMAPGLRDATFFRVRIAP